MSYTKTGHGDYILSCDKCNFAIFVPDQYWTSVPLALVPSKDRNHINYGHWCIDSVDPETGEAKHICPYCAQENQR